MRQVAERISRYEGWQTQHLICQWCEWLSSSADMQQIFGSGQDLAKFGKSLRNPILNNSSLTYSLSTDQRFVHKFEGGLCVLKCPCWQWFKCIDKVSNSIAQVELNLFIAGTLDLSLSLMFGLMEIVKF